VDIKKGAAAIRRRGDRRQAILTRGSRVRFSRHKVFRGRKIRRRRLADLGVTAVNAIARRRDFEMRSDIRDIAARDVARSWLTAR
jgi:hypothetical protein